VREGDTWARDFAARDYRVWLLTVAKKAPNTVNAHLTAVDAFYTHRGLGPANAGRVDLPAQAPRALEEAELRRVLRSAERLPSVRDKTIVRTLYYAGVRAAELVALDVDDVPTTARTGKVIVRAGNGRDGGKPRTVPSTPNCAPPWPSTSGTAGPCPAPTPARRCSSTGTASGCPCAPSTSWSPTWVARSAWTTCHPTSYDTRSPPTCCAPARTSCWSPSCSGTPR
jgi:hypothetical protein